MDEIWNTTVKLWTKNNNTVLQLRKIFSFLAKVATTSVYLFI